MRTSYLALLLAIGTAFASPAMGAPSGYDAGSIHVIPADSLLLDTPQAGFQDPHAYIRFKSPADVKTLINQGLEMRIFWLDEKGEPMEYEPADYKSGAYGPCKIYMTRIYALVPSEAYGADLGEMSIKWLGIDEKTMTFVPGRFKIVFEDKTDGSSMFRLNKGFADDYFAKGRAFNIQIGPAGSTGQWPSASMERDRRLKQSADYAKLHPIPHNCYSIKYDLSGLPVEQRVAALQSCEAEPAAPRPAAGGIVQLDLNIAGLL